MEKGRLVQQEPNERFCVVSEQAVYFGEMCDKWIQIAFTSLRVRWFQNENAYPSTTSIEEMLRTLKYRTARMAVYLKIVVKATAELMTVAIDYIGS